MLLWFLHINTKFQKFLFKLSALKYKLSYNHGWEDLVRRKSLETEVEEETTADPRRSGILKFNEKLLLHYFIINLLIFIDFNELSCSG